MRSRALICLPIATLNQTFGVTLQQIKNVITFIMELWNCVVLIHTRKFFHLKLLLGLAGSNRNPNACRCRNTNSVSILSHVRMYAEFDTFRTNCDRLVYDFKKKKKKRKKSYQQVTINTCCHHIILCTLHCKLSARPQFKAILLCCDSIHFHVNFV